MAQKATSKEDLATVAQRMTAAFTDGSAAEKLRERVKDRGMMFSPQLLTEVEALQADMCREWGYDADPTLQNLHGAVRTYPDLRPVISSLCDAEETMIDAMQSELAKANGIDLPPQGGHGHSHNGEPCSGHGHGNHGHSHGGGHGSHGHGGHGHSHNGVPCHGHGHGGHDMPPGALIAQRIAVALVQKSFTPDQMQFMGRIQQLMMQGRMPSGDDQVRAMQLQQVMSRKMSNMGPLVMGGMEALSDEERAELVAIEDKMKSGQPPSAADAKALEAAQDSIATYIATMGPMLAALRQQQQQGGSNAVGGPAAAGVSGSPSESTESGKGKKD